MLSKRPKRRQQQLCTFHKCPLPHLFCVAWLFGATTLTHATHTLSFIPQPTRQPKTLHRRQFLLEQTPLVAPTACCGGHGSTMAFRQQSSELEMTPTSSHVVVDDVETRRHCQILPWCRLPARSWKPTILACATLMFRGGAAHAASSVSALSSPLTILWRRRRLVRNILLLFVATKLIQQRIAVRRRQRQDATSEWERYARYPGARGRALMLLVFAQLLPLWAFGRLFRVERAMVHAGKVLTEGLLQLGPLYCKMGQILSCREEIHPSWRESLERLQDQIPAQTGEKALKLAHSAWSQGNRSSTTMSFNETFSDFDTTPLAAASLGQVHKAVLRSTNETVAIKLQRPFLRKIYDQDLAFLTKIARAVDRIGGKVRDVGGVQQSWETIFLDAEAILYREIDYRDEAENGIRFCQDFGLDKGGKASVPTAKSRDGKVLPSAAPWLRAPHVYGNLSSEQVLVMEFVPSIKITNTAKLDAANVTLEEREYLADCLGRAYLRQFCCNKFFSTDPHPGNLGCEIVPTTSKKPKSSNSKTRRPIGFSGAGSRRSSPSTTTMSKKEKPRRVRLVFYDFGQAATLTESEADGILDIIEAIVDMDVEKSMIAFAEMGVLKVNADLTKVRAKVADNYKTGKVKANRKRLSKRGYKFSPEAMTTKAIRNKDKKDKDDNHSSSPPPVVVNGDGHHGTATMRVNGDMNASMMMTTTIRSDNTTMTTTTTTTSIADSNNNNSSTTDGKNDDDDISDVMKYFTLPAEYAFVARALAQMGSVGKTLDSEFEFISSAAPWIYEIKGATQFLRDEFSKRLEKWGLTNIFPTYVTTTTVDDDKKKKKKKQ